MKDVFSHRDGVVTEFIRPKSAPSVIICVVTTGNGYPVIGQSLPVDARDFNEGAALREALNDAYANLARHERFAAAEKRVSP